MRFSRRWFLAALLALCGCNDTTTPQYQGQVIRVADWNYIQGKYFFLVNPNPTGPASPPGSVVNIRLYLDDRDVIDDVTLGARPARVWLDPIAKAPAIPGGYALVTGQFHLLKEIEDYTIPNDINFSFPRIELKTALAYNQTLAVAYQEVTNGDTVDVGSFEITPGDTLDLKMLRPADDEWANDLTTSPWAEVRNLEAKNVYSLGVHDIESGTLSIDVVLDIAGESGLNPDVISNGFGAQHALLALLGLDQKNNANLNDRTPDRRIDSEFVDLERGLIFFPDLRPFDPDDADVNGNSIREHSWPRAAGVDRPDTLGWYKDPNTGAPTPSSAEQRNNEVVPEIYDLKYGWLSVNQAQYHLYTIEGKITPRPVIPD